MKRWLPVLLAGAVAAAGCAAADTLALGEQPLSRAGAPIRTDRDVYQVRKTQHSYELTMELAYVNPTSGPVYIPTCHTPHPPALQKWVGGEWVTAYSPVVLECLGPPVVIGRGETYRYTYRVEASHRPNTFPRFEVAEVPGTYRLVWHILGTWEPSGPQPGLGEELPLEQRVSDSFRLEL